MEDEEKVAEPIVYEDLVDKRNDELMELLEGRSMKQLSERLNEMPEFDVAEFLSSLEDNRMPMLSACCLRSGRRRSSPISKRPTRSASSTPSPTRNWPGSSKSSTSTTPST